MLLMEKVREFWEADETGQDIFINEDKGLRLTRSQLHERHQARPYITYFITHLSDPRDEPIP